MTVIRDMGSLAVALVQQGFPVAGRASLYGRKRLS